MIELPTIKYQIRANRKQTSLNVNNEAFGECFLLYQAIKLVSTLSTLKLK